MLPEVSEVAQILYIPLIMRVKDDCDIEFDSISIDKDPLHGLPQDVRIS